MADETETNGVRRAVTAWAATASTLKWMTGLSSIIIIALLNAWAAQRLAFENDISSRIVIVERNQARVMERLNSSAKTLELIYQELKEHRNTGK